PEHHLSRRETMDPSAPVQKLSGSSSYRAVKMRSGALLTDEARSLTAADQKEAIEDIKEDFQDELDAEQDSQEQEADDQNLPTTTVMPLSPAASVAAARER